MNERGVLVSERGVLVLLLEYLDSLLPRWPTSKTRRQEIITFLQDSRHLFFRLLGTEYAAAATAGVGGEAAATAAGGRCVVERTKRDSIDSDGANWGRRRGIFCSASSLSPLAELAIENLS